MFYITYNSHKHLGLVLGSKFNFNKDFQWLSLEKAY